MQTCMNTYFLVQIFCPLNHYFLFLPLISHLAILFSALVENPGHFL